MAALAALAAGTIAGLRAGRPTGPRAASALAFLAGNLVLELNGHYLDVTEGAAMAALEGPEAALAGWIAGNAYPLHRWFS
jgi:hypothetical protein